MYSPLYSGKFLLDLIFTIALYSLGVIQGGGKLQTRIEYRKLNASILNFLEGNAPRPHNDPCFFEPQVAVSPPNLKSYMTP